MGDNCLYQSMTRVATAWLIRRGLCAWQIVIARAIVTLVWCHGQESTRVALDWTVAWSRKSQLFFVHELVLLYRCPSTTFCVSWVLTRTAQALLVLMLYYLTSLVKDEMVSPYHFIKNNTMTNIVLFRILSLMTQFAISFSESLCISAYLNL